MITCPDCQSKVDDNAVFCETCGFPFKSRDVLLQAPLPAASSSTPPPASSGFPMYGARWESPPPSAVAYSQGNIASGTCSACGHINTPGEMFCENCGVQLAPVASVPPPPPVPVGLAAQPVQAPAPPAVAHQSHPASGAAIPIPCPGCGFPNPSGEQYCQNCGYYLVGTSLPPSAPIEQSAVPQAAPSIPASTPTPQSSAPTPQPEIPISQQYDAPLSALRSASLSASPPAAVPSNQPCPVCGYVNQVGDVFCSNCGYQHIQEERPKPPPAPLPAVEPTVEPSPQAAPPAPIITTEACPVCGTINSAGEEFCLNCGLLLSPPKSEVTSEEESSAPLQAALDALPSDSGGITSQWPPLVSAPVITGRLFFPSSNSDLPLPPKTEILIGRSDPDRSFFPDIDLGGQGQASGSVSRRHARMLMQGDQLLIEDLNSTNSTYLNKVRIEPGKPALLKPGDELRVGGITLVYYAE
jgi:hypothetical protein